MKRGRYLYALAAGAVVGIAFGPWNQSIEAKQNGSTLVPPTFKVDPFWPKPLPDNWVTGEIGGFQNGGLVSPEGVGGADTATATLGGAFKSKASPPVIEFDAEGNVVNSWGNPALVPATDPTNPNKNAVLPNGTHGCFVDYQDNVWIAGNGDGIVQKYSHSGTLLLQIGQKFVCDTPTGACANVARANRTSSPGGGS